MIGALVVVMHLAVHDANTGNLLEEKTKVIDTDSTDRYGALQECLLSATAIALVLAMHWRETYPNASANVTCRWERMT
jgi:hypothetical protein